MKTFEELIELGWKMVDVEIPELKDTGSIWMKYIVLSDTGTDYIVAAADELINDPKPKEELMARVRERVQQKNAHAVLTISDAWISQTSSRDMKTLQRIEKMGIPAAVAEGLITSREALLAFIATPIQTIRLLQFYRREDGNKIIMEERDIQRGPGDPGSGGRLSHFFDHVTPVQA